MKKSALFTVVMLYAVSVFAQPLILEQASPVVKKGQMEAGIENLSYGTDSTEITDTTIKITQTTMNVPLSARYGVTDTIEASLTLPMQSLAYKQTNGGFTVTDISDSKMADAILTGKKSFDAVSGIDMSASLGLTLPTGAKSDKFITEFKKGTNITPAVQASRQFNFCRVNANLSYAITGEFEANNTAKTKVNPSDILSLGIGAERPCMMNKDVTIIAEFIINSLSDASVGGTTVTDSGGTQMDLALGARYTIKQNIKTKLGIDLSLGDEKNRTYDWKVIAGVTYLFNI